MWKRILACVLILLLILVIAFCPSRRYTVTDPALAALTEELKTEFPDVKGVRVSILRPTLYWDVTLKNEESEDEVFSYLVELIHTHNIYEVIQEKEFLHPQYHWASSMEVNIRVQGIFSKIHKTYKSHYYLQEPGANNAVDNFKTWTLIRDIHRPDGESLPERVVFSPTPISIEPDTPDALDTLVSEAVIEHFKSGFRQGVYQAFATEYHETVGTVEKVDTITVYIVTLYAQYQLAGDEIALTGAVCTPAAITFTKMATGGCEVTEFWEAENGTRFEPSIREKFPEDIAEATLELMSHGLGNAMEICDARARAFFSGSEGAE